MLKLLERAGSAGVELSAFAYLVASLQTDVISSVLHKKIKHRIFVLSFWWWVREESLALFFYFLMDRICQEKQVCVDANIRGTQYLFSDN